MDNIEYIKKKMKENHHIPNMNKSKKESNKIYNYLIRMCLLLIITLVVLITLKSNKNLKTPFYKYVFDKNISFAHINQIYKKHFGNSIPFSDVIEDKTKIVSSEKLTYKKSSIYKDGVKLSVNNNYMVPAFNSGLVVFIGDKDEYKNLIIVQQVDGVDVWYSNVTNKNLSLYDYIEKGSFVGEVKTNELYLVFKKDGNVLDYKKYIG
jgi:stage IV sporulation protein FA